MQGWHTATLTRNQVVGPQLHRLSLEVSAFVAKSFHTPGQYQRVRLSGGEDAFFAMASSPGTPHFEYLIRAHEGVARAWSALAVGATVEVSAVDGPGFPLERARGQNLLLIGTGTGFAPLRSVISSIRPRRAEFGRIEGAYGAMTPEHLAFGNELAQWTAEAMRVVPIVTIPSLNWTGAVGLVQMLLPTFQVDDAVAFLCGQPEMINEVTTLLDKQGLPASRIFTNLPT